MSPPSPRVTSRNLSYASELPPFLAALHAQASGAPPDPRAAGQRRSAKKRSSSEEAEDAPLVVDELGNALSVQVDKDGVVREPPAEGGAAAAEGDAAAAGADEPEKQQQEAKSAIGGRKRKAGKVVGADGTRHKDRPDSDDRRPSAPAEKRAKKKANKIKLSFEEDEG